MSHLIHSILVRLYVETLDPCRKVWTLTVIMVIVFIYELIVNVQLEVREVGQNRPISLKVSIHDIVITNIINYVD